MTLSIPSKAKVNAKHCIELAGRASPGVLTHGTHSRALCRTPKTKLIGRPVPEIWPNLARTDRLTDTRQTRLTNQPTGQPDSSRFASIQL